MKQEEIEKELAYAYFLKNIPGVGDKSIELLWNQYCSYEKVCLDIIDYVAYKKKTTQNTMLCKQITNDNIGKNNDINRIYSRIYHFLNETQIDVMYTSILSRFQELKKQNITCYAKGVDGYPVLLEHIPDAPSMIFVKGGLPDRTRPIVAIVGARNCSQYGSLMARTLGEKLAKANIGVVSGLARGIDGISQHATLQAGGATFGVLGCGPDLCYPEENYELYNALAGGINGSGIISEFLPGTKAQSNHFPMRNRIISGLSDAVVVIEAKEKSGTFITVNQALEQGKSVYALPGRVCDGLSYGCNRLINQGAGILWDIDEFIDEVYYEKQMTQNIELCKPHNQDHKNTEDKQLSLKDLIIEKRSMKLSEIQKQIFQCLDLNYESLDMVLCKLNITITIQELLSQLSELENMELIESENGYYRIKS